MVEKKKKPKIKNEYARGQDWGDVSKTSHPSYPLIGETRGRCC